MISAKHNKFIYILLVFLFFVQSAPVSAFGTKIKGVVTKESASYSSNAELKKFFGEYEKLTNNQNIEKLMDLYDDSYLSADKFDKARLKELALQSWESYPKVKYSMKVISCNASYENATIIAQENISGEAASKVEYIKGNGYIDSDAVTVYYLKKFYGGWKIVSDYIIDEKTSLKYGVAKDLQMKIDAPTLAKANQEYSSILQLDVPKDYIALISLNNEPITFPAVKAEEVFRTMKTSGIQERILKTNPDFKNENAVASIGIATADVQDKNIQINIVGIAFLTSRVNLSLPNITGTKEK